MRSLWLVLLLMGPMKAEEIQCPKSIQVRQIPLDVPDGWTAGAATDPKYVLKQVTFFDGKPEEEASLVYDRLIPGRSGARATWSFLPKSQIWVSCSYTGTSVTVARPLQNISRCVVVYKTDSKVDGLPEIDRISCR